ncbi:hypothetical protein DNTS_028808 [Danionella cerebrum]|uniref:Immediate early response 2 protein n=1 Tax=Danionella cerebrum TaxID=2873325 RepID=A0A553NMV9_9TELE|nr:hypothetical protein DNTS_028808 [Danionella translucida]
MDVTAEAKQILVQALGKMYSSRSQRGGLRLHRSLLLTLVMKSARDIYHSVRLAKEMEPQSSQQVNPTEEEAQDRSGLPLPEVSTEGGTRDCYLLCPGKENISSDRVSRKRRSATTTHPDFLPCKKAKLEFTEVSRVLQRSSTNCGREMDSLCLVQVPRTMVSY